MKRRRRDTLPALESLADLGTGFERRGGRVIVRDELAAGQGVALADVPDIDRTDKRATVRVARTWSVLDDLHANGDLTKRQFDAANRFLDDLSRATGGTSCSWALMLAGRGNYEGLSEMQRRAIRAVQRVRLMLGLNRDTVFWWVVLDNRTPSDFENEYRLGHHGIGLQWLRLALDAVDEHYNGARSSY